MSILFINGSPNKNGNTAALAAELLKGHKYETLNLTDYTIGAYGQNLPGDGLDAVIDAMKQADTIVIGSPLYWHNICGSVRNVLDRFYGKVENGSLSGRKLYFVFQGAAPEKWMLDAGEYTMKRFAAAGIEMHCQIVLCRGVNDGAELMRTMRDLAALYPQVDSVSIVPAGITKYREKLYPLTPFSKEECRNVIAQVEGFAEECLAKYGSHIFFCADEMYVKGEAKFPDGRYYEGYPQIENGVGMLRSMADEFCDAMEDIDDLDPHRPRSCSIATGVAAYGFISLLVEEMKKRCYNLDCTVYEIKNEFFGENITVAGLVTAGDISRQLRGKNLGRVLFLPDVMLRHEKDRFLDDRTPAWLEDKLGVKIHFVACDGYAFVSDILKLS